MNRDLFQWLVARQRYVDMALHLSLVYASRTRNVAYNMIGLTLFIKRRQYIAIAANLLWMRYQYS
jgi:hypothetical protein